MNKDELFHLLFVCSVFLFLFVCLFSFVVVVFCVCVLFLLVCLFVFYLFVAVVCSVETIVCLSLQRLPKMSRLISERASSFNL